MEFFSCFFISLDPEPTFSKYPDPKDCCFYNYLYCTLYCTSGGSYVNPIPKEWEEKKIFFQIKRQQTVSESNVEGWRWSL